MTQPVKTEILVGTRKGLFVLRGPRGGRMEVAARRFAGQPVEYAMHDPRSGRTFASVTHGHFGPHLYSTEDPTAEDEAWSQSLGPAFPTDSPATDGDAGAEPSSAPSAAGPTAAVERIWTVEPGVEEGVMWAGVAPAALFKSEDGGHTWSLNRPLWEDPSHPKWHGGLGGLCLHSICTWPGDPARLAVAASAIGVWLSDDGGATWRQGVSGLESRYLPAEARADAFSWCVHSMRRAPREPKTLYIQFHGGVYRSDDAGASWTEISAGLPADFGFPMAIDPKDPARAFVIPLVADRDRVTPEGKLRVYETRDRGTTWRPLADGLPQEDAYLTVLRQAFCADGGDPLGLYFGTVSGELFASGDDGRSWATAAERLPPILSVRPGAPLYL